AFEDRLTADDTTGGGQFAPEWIGIWESARDRGVTYGDGGMFSTATDYTRFLRMMIEGGTLDGQRVLSPDTVALMLQNHLPEGTQLNPAGGLGFGLGFSVVLDPEAVSEPTVPGQFGWGGAAATYALGDTDSRATAVFMNALMPSGGQLQSQFRVLAIEMLLQEDTDDTAAPTPTTEPIVNTHSGRVEGTWEDDGQLASFKSIPYAAPPVGALRWKPPAPVEPWEGVMPAKTWPPACPQQAGLQQMAAGMLRSVGEDPALAPTFNETSEDCLYLNVWTRHLGRKDLAPVIVWIHGGGYRQGAAFFECSQACDAGFVAVNFNMRLGALGFFSHPSLSAESPTGCSGNQGLQDAVAALRWVRDNISAFGGDPDRVILGGLSAGGGAAGLMLAMPEADGLFHAAFSVSPAPIPISHGLKPGFQGQNTGHDIGRMLSVGVGLDPEASVEELQAVPIEQLMGAALALEALLVGRDFAFTPRIDGHVLPEPFLDRVASGKTPDIPLVIGAATHDDSFVSNFIVNRLARGDFEGYVRKQLGPEADAALEAYGRPEPGEINNTMRTFLRDIVFLANARLVAEAWNASGRPAWLYYNHARFPEGHPGHAVGSFHGYGFGNGSLNAIPWDPEGVFEPLNQRMFQRLMGLANARNPNADGLVPWPEYNRETDAYLELNIEADAVKRGLMPERLDPIQRAYRLQVNAAE
ncbi:MAG: carboxylesterase family protein, partial [Phycisphaerales bacterium]|nr:carboxylesterase family protein [Phycisphaerales bacterium]